MNIDDIQTNYYPYCVDCDKLITAYNDSGWEILIDEITTQKICKDCDVNRSKNISLEKNE